MNLLILKFASQNKVWLEPLNSINFRKIKLKQHNVHLFFPSEK